jgi:menaquinone-dependent protoporphyrinogen IX oxidase
MRALVVYESMFGNTHLIAGNIADGLGHRDGLAATFDIRLNGVPAFTGRASRPMARLLKRHGRRLVAAPASFLIGSQNTLLDGEAARARRWGMTLGAVSKTYLPAPA